MCKSNENLFRKCSFFQTLTSLEQEFDHVVPNTKLTSIQTVSDVVTFFLTPVADGTALEDLSRLNLPKNLHIQMEPLRFDPENDTYFDGKTAFPGNPTIVSSLKYSRYYSGHSGQSRDTVSRTNYEEELSLEEDRFKFKKKRLPSEGVTERKPNKKGAAIRKLPVI